MYRPYSYFASCFCNVLYSSFLKSRTQSFKKWLLNYVTVMKDKEILKHIGQLTVLLAPLIVGLSWLALG